MEHQKNYMKTILTLFMFLTVFTSYSQTEFCKGWADGFKEGYCYGIYGCVAPYPPPCAIPNIGNDNYRGGYNQGFVAGKNKKDVGSGTSNGGAYGQLRPLKGGNIGAMVEEYNRNNHNKSTKRKFRKVPKYKKIETFDSLVNKGLLYHKFKLYSHCIEYYNDSKKYKKYDDRLEYVTGDSYWKLYQENKKNSNLKKAIKILKLSSEHGNKEARKLLDEIESM